jgi:hypothetical protein
MEAIPSTCIAGAEVEGYTTNAANDENLSDLKTSGYGDARGQVRASKKANCKV